MISLMPCVLKSPSTNQKPGTWKLVRGTLKVGQRVDLCQGSKGANISPIQKISRMGDILVVTTLSGSEYLVEV